MEPNINKTKKLVLRNLEVMIPSAYIISEYAKKALQYPQICLSDPQNKSKYQELVSLDCEMLQTQNGCQICRALIINANKQVIYNKWFLPDYPIVDYLTPITGINQQILLENAITKFGIQQKQGILQLINGKIVVGHDLANDFRYLKIQHHAFIDTLDIYPHNYGLPFKTKLKNLTMDLLKRPIQWQHHNPQQDAIAALQIVQKHISQGKGTIQQVQILYKQPESYKNIWEIILEAELDKNKIVGLFLRGSRAFNIHYQQNGYKSDWDYFCVYDVNTTIHGRLIKLTQIDITIYDLKTFYQLLNDLNDIPCLQLFYLPEECQIVNKLKLPQINIQALRESLGLHLSKIKMKLKRFKNDPSKKWKILKVVHLKMRFINFFMQYFHYNKIKNIKQMNLLWDQMKHHYLQQNNLQKTVLFYEKKATQMKNQLKQTYRTIRKVGHLQGKSTKNTIQLKGNQLSLINKMPQYSSLQAISEFKNFNLHELQQLQIQIYCSRKYSNLVFLKCLQSASYENLICRKANGLILDNFQCNQVVSMPYDKFFDYNSHKYSQISNFNFKNYKIYQKYDGSLAVLYFYDGIWQVASKTDPDGQNQYCYARKQTLIEFRKQFWRIFNQLKYKLPQIKDKNKNFMFELMSKNHLIVVNRNQDQLILHGIRNIVTLIQQDHTIYGKLYDWKVAQPLNISIEHHDYSENLSIKQHEHLVIKDSEHPFAQIVQVAQRLNPLKQQGFILCDDRFTRIKVKNSHYLRIKWLGQTKNLNQDPSKLIVVQIILAGEADVFSKYCPEWKNVIQSFLNKIQRLNCKVLKQYQTINTLTQQQFAKQVKLKDQSIHSFLFALKKNFNIYKGRIEHSMAPKKFYKYLKQNQF